jgi:pimeloyl-ACP methyl ester carboxylesterase
MQDRAQLVLLPGLGADHRLLEPQRAAFPQLIVPKWIEPRRGESLPEYAARLAETIPPRRPLVLGGISLGGMVAYEMARHLRPDALVLIASCRSCKSIRTVFRWLRPVLSRLPAWCVHWTKPFAPLGVGILGGRDFKGLCLQMFRDADCRFMSWVGGSILRWQPKPLEGIPVFQIHGARDRLIPSSPAQADQLIPDGGHLINLTHAEEVNRLMERAIAAVAGNGLG